MTRETQNSKLPVTSMHRYSRISSGSVLNETYRIILQDITLYGTKEHIRCKENTKISLNNKLALEYHVQMDAKGTGLRTSWTASQPSIRITAQGLTVGTHPTTKKTTQPWPATAGNKLQACSWQLYISLFYYSKHNLNVFLYKI